MLPLIVFLVVFTVAESKTKLEDIIPICDFKDPKLGECAAASTQKLLPLLKDGVKDLHLIAIDPLTVDTLDFGQDSGPVSLTWKFTKAKINGVSAAKVKSMKLDMSKLHFVGDLFFPRFEISGDYVGKGKILLLPIEGKGFGNITTTDMDIHVEFDCKTLKKKKGDYLTIDKLKLTYKFKDVFISFENLFGGNRQLGEATNRFLNENARTLAEEMRGTLEAVFGELSKQIMNNVFNNVPVNEAFRNPQLS